MNTDYEIGLDEHLNAVTDAALTKHGSAYQHKLAHRNKTFKFPPATTVEMKQQRADVERIVDDIFYRCFNRLHWELENFLEDSINDELTSPDSKLGSSENVSRFDENSSFWGNARSEALEPIWQAIDQAMPQARTNLAKHVREFLKQNHRSVQ